MCTLVPLQSCSYTCVCVCVCVPMMETDVQAHGHARGSEEGGDGCACGGAEANDWRQRGRLKDSAGVCEPVTVTLSGCLLLCPHPIPSASAASRGSPPPEAVLAVRSAFSSTTQVMLLPFLTMLCLAALSSELDALHEGLDMYLRQYPAHARTTRYAHPLTPTTHTHMDTGGAERSGPRGPARDRGPVQAEPRAATPPVSYTHLRAHET